MSEFKQKDPAVLFFISDWLTSTAEMDSDVRGWYLNLILHNYDKKSLPNNIEKLAVLAGVKFSEFKRFEQVFEQVFKHKFEQDETGRLTNRKTDTILKARETFQMKRSEAGKVSYVMKYMAKNYTKLYKNNKLKFFVKEKFDYNIELKNEHMLKQVFEHLFELYINENENENENEIKNIIESIIKNKGGTGGEKPKDDIIKTWKNDFSIYLQNLEAGFSEVKNNKKIIAQLETIYPNVDVVKSITAQKILFWETESGWKNKKSHKTEKINWESTFKNNFKKNLIYKTTNNNQTASPKMPEQPPRVIIDFTQQFFEDAELDNDFKTYLRWRENNNQPITTPKIIQRVQKHFNTQLRKLSNKEKIEWLYKNTGIQSNNQNIENYLVTCITD